MGAPHPRIPFDHSHRTMRTLLLSLCLVTATMGAFAQQHVKIDDPKALDAAPDVHKVKGAVAGLQAAGITGEQQDLVLKYGDRTYWPEGIRNDSARAANAPYIRNYACFRVCTFLQDSLPWAVLMVPARENIHMPEGMRPVADFYLALPESKLTAANTGKARPEISRGPRWKDRPTARIIKPDDLYATYDLARDSTGLATLRQRGMSPAEVDAVIFRSHERNWPEGIDGFDKRYPRIQQFKKYKAYLGARWDDKVLLIVPVEKNKKMPATMRPFVDLYFVYAAPAVEVKQKK